MSKDKENVPKLRFPGFSGAWVEREFAEVFNLSVSNNTLSRANLNYRRGEIKNIHYGDILIKFDSIVDVNDDIVPFVSDGTVENYRNQLLRNGDIIIADTAEDQTTGKAIEITGIENNYAVSGLHTIVARPNKNFAPSYLGYYMNSAVYRHQLLPFMQGIKVLSLSKTNLSKTKVSYPTDTAEQEKIGSLFHNVDNLITLHQHKLNNVKKLKAGLLQKMFPKDGEDSPEVRFLGFTRAWERRDFSEVFNLSVSNNTLSRANLNYERGEIKNIHYGDILVKFDSIVNVNDDIVPFVTSGTVANFRNQLLKNGDIIIADTAEDETTGKAIEITGIVDNYAVSGLHTIIARPNKNFAPNYLGYYMNSAAYHDQLFPLMQGIKVLSLSKANLSKTEVSYPIDTTEQLKIGELFHNLDNLIILHQRKLDHLQQQKKALLQQMFV